MQSKPICLVKTPDYILITYLLYICRTKRYVNYILTPIIGTRFHGQFKDVEVKVLLNKIYNIQSTLRTLFCTTTKGFLHFMQLTSSRHRILCGCCPSAIPLANSQFLQLVKHTISTIMMPPCDGSGTKCFPRLLS